MNKEKEFGTFDIPGENRGLKAFTAVEPKEDIKDAVANIAASDADDAGADDEDMVLKFSKPITFEGRTYTEVDLSGMEDLTTGDVASVMKMLSKTGISVSNLSPETSIDFACYFAARAAKLPVEFFYKLPAKDAVKVRVRVTSFLLT